MIPTSHDYYRRRAREQRALALAAPAPEERAMHDRLFLAYVGLARRHRPRLALRVKEA